MKPVTVLMYHATPGPDAGTASGPRSADARTDAPDADPHYSVALARFGAQVAAIQADGLRAVSVAARLADADPTTAGRPAVCITFDDGLASNAGAADLLAGAGASADFFVNPSTIGTRGHLDWPTLRRMADAGMSIQSHGMTHRYLDELPPDEVAAELADSRKAIEDGIGRPVTLYAPAGGRTPAGFAALAAHHGYQAVCSSRVGLWHAGAGPTSICPEIPRFAVLAGTSTGRFMQWIRQSPAEMLRQSARYRVLRASKRLLGNGGHERIRALLLNLRGGGPA